VFESSVKNGAAFVIGRAFDPKGVKNNGMRLAFSGAPEEKIEGKTGKMSEYFPELKEKK